MRPKNLFDYDRRRGDTIEFDPEGIAELKVLLFSFLIRLRLIASLIPLG